MANDNRWGILNAYFRDNPSFLVQHHLDSFNDLVDAQMPYIIKSLNPFVTLKNDEDGTLKHRIEIYVGGPDGERVEVERPVMPNAPRGHVLYPNEARLRSLTYKSSIYADIYVRFITYDPASGLAIDETTKTLPRHNIGAIPTMVGSKLCNTSGFSSGDMRDVGECDQDPGGYFVVSGKEKVIVARERIATNRLFVTPSKDPKFSFEGMVRCTVEEAAVFPKTIRFYVYGKDSRLRKDDGDDDPAAEPPADEEEPEQSSRVIRKNAIVMDVPGIVGRIPLFIMFRALGVISDKSILEHVVYDVEDASNKVLLDFLHYSVIDANDIYDQEGAMTFIMNRLAYKEISYVKYVLVNDFFPNATTFARKALYLGHAVNMLVKVCLGIDKETDKDNYGLKRVDVSGVLIGNLFRDFYNKFRNECRNQVDRAYHYGIAKKDGVGLDALINDSNKWKVFQGHIIENNLMRSLKGDWGLNGDKNGIVQDLNRISYMGFISHLRRVNTPIDSSTKIVAPHRLHPSQWGMMCPCESPDGANIGLLKNLALLCHVSPDVPSRVIMEVLRGIGFYDLDALMPAHMLHMTKVILNSNWVGCTDAPDAFVATLRRMRRDNQVPRTTSVSWSIPRKEVYIFSDAGRVCRPLMIVEEGNRLAMTSSQIESLDKGKVAWHDLFVKDAPVELVDVSESDTCLFATTQEELRNKRMKYTHCELHASTMFAVLTANIPFANHNQAPRNYFSGAQGKQAIGVYSTQFNNRMDTTGYVLHYPQRAIVNTRYMAYMQNNSLPNGENAIVAIMCYSGYNQEDSMIINRAAVERGMFNLTCFKTIVETQESNEMTGQKLLFANPKKHVQKLKRSEKAYETLDEHGFPKLNTYIKNGTVYIGKVLLSPERGQGEEPVATTDRLEDRSEVADKTLSGIVDKVFVYTSEPGSRQCKIRLRKVRTPVLGDKHASRHAQKGTIGMIMAPEDMPYTKDGIVPDLIINPHAIPTRMTIGHLIECVLGKLGSLEGNCYDATPFCGQDIEGCYDALQRMGYDRHGDEVMYNGITGEQIPTHIFVGPTYMLRLKHMVQDKINYRARGESGYNQLTRQPVKSRAKGGGLRIGEMENWAVYSHGMSAFTKESMMERSDRFAYTVDGGLRVETPFSAKQLMHELNAIGLDPVLTYDTDDGSCDDA